MPQREPVGSLPNQILTTHLLYARLEGCKSKIQVNLTSKRLSLLPDILARSSCRINGETDLLHNDLYTWNHKGIFF